MGILPRLSGDMCQPRPGLPGPYDELQLLPRSTWSGRPAWSRLVPALCNGIILFDDGHDLTPDGHDGPVALSA